MTSPSEQGLESESVMCSLCRIEFENDPIRAINGNYDVCLACGGDGGFDDTYIGTDHEVTSDYRECRECHGSGRVFQE